MRQPTRPPFGGVLAVAVILSELEGRRESLSRLQDYIWQDYRD